MNERFRPSRSIAAFFVWLLVVCSGCESNVETIGPRLDYQAAQRVLEQFIEHEMESKGLPAISIALVDDQEIVWASGFGYANPADSVPASARSVYRVGSVSKLFTDIAVMQLVEREELDLDAPITRYLPDFNPGNSSEKPVTLRHLMSHRSGLVREPPVGHYFDLTEPSLEQTVSSLNSTQLVYAPETVAKYSNAAIAAVGYVLERTQRESFPSYLDRTVLEPLGMVSSAFEPDADIVANLAKGYMWTLDGREFEAPTFGLGMSPAGSMYSTVEDLARFMSVLIVGGEGPGGRILRRATLEEMWTPQYAEPGATSGYGIGFGISDLSGRLRVGHSGAIYGFATELAVLPEEKIGVAVVTTKDFANSVVARIADAALETMLAVRAGREPSDPRATEPVSPDLARELRGRYRSTQRGVELTEWAGRLFLQRDDGGSRAEVRAFGDTLVVDDVHAFGTRLHPVESGIVLGGDTLARLPDRRPAPVPSEWSGLIGEYGWDHNTLYVLERDGSSHRQARGNGGWLRRVFRTLVRSIPRWHLEPALAT